MKKNNTKLGKDIEQFAHDWQYKEPLGTPFKVDLWEYIAVKLKEKYEIKEMI